MTKAAIAAGTSTMIVPTAIIQIVYRVCLSIARLPSGKGPNGAGWQEFRRLLAEIDLVDGPALGTARKSRLSHILIDTENPRFILCERYERK
jgi:hypothetical protein